MAFDLSILDDTVLRWRAFASRIRQRADELHAQGFEEALAMKREAASASDSQYYLFWSGVGGQIGSLRDKLEITFEQSVRAAFEQKAGRYVAAWDRYELCDEAQPLWHRLQQEKNGLDDHLLHLSCTNIADFDAHDDAEAQYLKILQEHEQQKDRFACITCGAALTISRVFCIATYVDCPYCRTQNTFQPSDAAYGLPAIAEQLAERRAGEARRHWEAAAAQVPIWSAGSSAAWHDRKQREVDAYVGYIDTKFDALDNIVPDLKAQNDLVRSSRIQEMKKAIRPTTSTQPQVP